MRILSTNNIYLHKKEHFVHFFDFRIKQGNLAGFITMITLLPIPLYLLSVKKYALDRFMHPIINNLLFKGNQHFFSFTENSTEISIIAEQSTKTEFNPFLDQESCTFCPDTFRALVRTGF
jgi:hypothetical protein